MRPIVTDVLWTILGHWSPLRCGLLSEFFDHLFCSRNIFCRPAQSKSVSRIRLLGSMSEMKPNQYKWVNIRMWNQHMQLLPPWKHQTHTTCTACVCVCVSRLSALHNREPYKTDEPIEMPFAGMSTRVGPRNYALDKGPGRPNSRIKSNFGALKPSAMRPFIRILWPLIL